DMVPLSKEIEYVQKYIDIQNIRFNNSINLYIKVDEQLNDILVPKLILQPIVENTIQHGFKNKLDKKHVTIEGEFYNNNLILKISDNGNGISKEKYEEILESLEYEKEPVNHIGLYNVNKRLKLNYNQESGIKIESKENYCSTITLIL
ncbi:sensor histidine kinase, partial [Clostridium perfringens]|uniref:sensor histidine kinase n=2 Tax=Clostridium TaxID=1485 RepID=UPI002ACD83E7